MSNGTESTLDMLRRAYPGGVPASLLLPVIRALYEQMSDRQLAVVVAEITGEDPAASLNRVYEAAGLHWQSPSVQAVLEILKKHGYDAWCEED